MTVADTSFIIDVLRGDPKAIRLLDDLRRSGASVRVPAAVVQELYYGLGKAQLRPVGRRALESLLAGIPTADFTRAIAQNAGLLEARLEGAGRKAGRFDLQIAATALYQGESLVTRDAAHVEIEALDTVTY